MNLPHSLDRTVVIRARPETVFGFFTHDDRWAAWWGPGSTIEPRKGGRVYVRYANGVEASGEVLEIVSPQRLVFTFGFASGQPMAPGASRVTIHLEPHADGTRLSLLHEFAEVTPRDQHIQGWRYQLSVFANVVTDALNHAASRAVDHWFEAWADPDDTRRTATIKSIAATSVRFSDRFSLVEGVEDLLPHIAAAQRFMPGVRLTRTGAVRHCQGTVLADWAAVGPDDQPRGAGTNVFTFNADGLITSVVGFWQG